MPPPATKTIQALDYRPAVAAEPPRRRRVWPVVLVVALLAVVGAAAGVTLYQKFARHSPSVSISFPAGTRECRPPAFTPTLGPQNGYTYSAVNPKASCEFAESVRQVYGAGPRAAERTVNAYSPTTRLSYDMHCMPQQSVVVVCSGGADAVVYLY